MKKSLNQLSVFLLTMALCFVFSTKSFAESAESIDEAFKGGKISGEIGSYFEFTNMDAENSNFGWSTAYLTLKYETMSWNQLTFGSRFFAHGELYNDNDDSITDPYTVDIETKITLPELYLNYAFLDSSNATFGRFEHGKISHIDDAQSEGAYVSFKEIEGTELIAGIMRRFAEIDYDDGEDFGRTNDSQELGNNAAFGTKAADVLFFLEAKTQINDNIKVNPYMMYHDGYAQVYGIDTDVKFVLEKYDMTIGSEFDYYTVNADVAGSSNSQDFSIAPYVKKGPFDITLGYAKFDDDNALNKPSWLRDYLTPVLDQVRSYGQAGAGVIFGKIKYSNDKFWTHFAFGEYNYNQTAAAGDRTKEIEIQFGYKIAKNLDFNVRLFDVQLDNVDNKDYQKVESIIKFKF